MDQKDVLLVEQVQYESLVVCRMSGIGDFHEQVECLQELGIQSLNGFYPLLGSTLASFLFFHDVHPSNRTPPIVLRDIRTVLE